MTYRSKACAALVLVQAKAPEARARTPQDKARYATDAGFGQVADAAYRTVTDPRRQPWPSPPERYDIWRTITFKFDSRDYQ